MGNLTVDVDAQGGRGGALRVFPFKADKQTELIFYCSLSIISPPFKAQTKSHHFAMHCRVRQCNGDDNDDNDDDNDIYIMLKCLYVSVCQCAKVILRKSV